MRLIDADALANYANNQIVGITANDIMRFPTVDAEPVKHGRWIYPYPQRDICRCTNCKFSVQDRISNVFEMFNYCPNCGARMIGGDEE